MEPSDHLFRREAGRMVAAVTRVFGVHNLDLAEDVVQNAFCRALEVWKFRGVPENPAAWLMATAKNRALDVLRRDRTVRTFAPELGRLLQSEWTLVPVLQELFAPNAIKDDLPAAIASLPIRSIRPRLANSSCVLGGTKPHASTSKQRLRWHAIQWSVNSSIGASTRAWSERRRDHACFKFANVIRRGNKRGFQTRNAEMALARMLGEADD